jgi:DNA modification methylase
MIFNKDAQERFLEPKSVKLFITHPPYFNVHFEQYGNPEQQIQNTLDMDLFHNNMTTVVKNMEDALMDDGNIFIMVANDMSGPKLVHEAVKATNLVNVELFIWDFEESHPDVGYSPTILIYRLVKNYGAYQNNYEIKNYVLRMPWENDLEQYSNIGFIADAFNVEIAKTIILKYSEPGDVVGDLMAGTGTVAYAAKELQRKYVYNDVSTSQYDIAKARLG